MNEPRPYQPDHGSQALAEALALCFRVLRVALALAVAAYVLSGLTVVRPQERALVLTFGALPGPGAARVWTPGFHWAPPRPFAEILRIEADRVRSIEIGSPAVIANAPADPLQDGWRHYTLTADANLVRARWALRYTVTDPESFLLRFGDADTALSNEFRRAVLVGAARASVDRILRSDVEGVRADIEDILRQRCQSIGLGVRIERVEALVLRPPAQVAAAFDDVIQAGQERGTRISEAREYAARRTNEASGEAAKLRSEAAADRTRNIAGTRADAAYFERLLPQYRARPGVVQATLLQDGLTRALGRVSGKYLLHRDAEGRQELRLWLGPPRDAPKSATRETHADGR